MSMLPEDHTSASSSRITIEKLDRDAEKEGREFFITL